MTGSVLDRVNLGLKFNDLSAVAKKGESLLTTPNAFGEDVGGHRSLETIVPDALSNPEHSISELHFGRFINEETGLKLGNHNTRPPVSKTIEPREVPPLFLSGSLTSCNGTDRLGIQSSCIFLREGSSQLSFALAARAVVAPDQHEPLSRPYAAALET